MTRSRPLTWLRLAVLAALVALAAGASAARAADRIETVAGSGAGGFGGDGGPATAALLSSPSDLAPLDAGDAYLIADTANHRIRRVGADGTITTVAGAGPAAGATGAFAGDGGLATGAAARLNQPRGVASTSDGGFLIADTGNNRIRAVSPAGVITTVAGNGQTGVGENATPATQSGLNAPQGVAAIAGGGFLIADTGNNRVRLVLPNGLIFTVAGSGSIPGFSGDGGASTAATLNAPARAIFLPGGGYLIADTGNNRIRRVDLRGTITTVAGSDTVPSFSGDGGPATAARLNLPEGLAVRPDGSIAIADTGNDRIREVDAGGTIRTVAGNGTLGFSGDGGLPTAAQLARPRAVELGAGTRLRIADTSNHRVRLVAPEPPPGGGGGGGDPTTPPRDTTPTVPPRQVPPGVAPPVLGRTAVATPLSGIVLIRRPGSGEFVGLDAAAGIPLGSEIDATRGSILLLFTTDARGRRASAIVSEGRFVVRQPARPGLLDRGQRPGTLVLSGPLVGCRATPGTVGRARRRGPALRPRASAAARRKRGRRLRVQADGSIKTQGKYGAAIVRGTRWRTVDRCPSDPRPGTLVTVSEGRVAVRSFVLRRTVLVRAGRRYLAPARRR